MNTLKKVLKKWECRALGEPEDEQDQNLIDALSDFRAAIESVDLEMAKVLAAVQAYLPPDGISKDELINRVIATVDPGVSQKETT